MNTTISFDESGNTGQDMLNEQQRAFVLASLNVKPGGIEKLNSIFDSNEEIHFVKLKNSDKGRKQIIKFINDDFINENNIIVSVCDKEYAVVGHIVDQLIETLFYNNQIDIYKYGKNIAFTNSIYMFGNFYWDKQLYKNMLVSFVSMIRIKDQRTINEFYKNAKKLLGSINDKSAELIQLVVDSEKYITEIIEGVTQYTLDVTLSSFLVLSNYWFQNLNQKLNILFDNSKQIEYYNDYIQFMRDLKIRTQEIGYGSRKMIFPTQIKDLKLVDSSKFKSIQYADLIASTIAFMYNNKNQKQEPFVKEIQNSKLLKLSNFHTIWPSSDLTPEELDMTDASGQNVLDFLATHQINKNNL
ncbi:DUF3800 domain-containing protein [Muricauda sp. 334s03]|uniref:DUF3800 domain-containing protein n=1 Tax=Flagellimonas yonaguniensis TaxID=3031325 RepID=A0ABT5XX51_9FLAO|nr:DUF3800 domain-containing protein [[Muricauda] yonaguniensis]MDF0715756.1 DUF3800 domain-containing protein [[Muricauda] yonaguniensis]